MNIFLGKIHKNKMKEAGTWYKCASTWVWRKCFYPHVTRNSGKFVKVGWENFEPPDQWIRNVCSQI